jgi:hypothetical protein
VPGALDRYRFGSKTADFLLCRDCGVYLGAVMQSARGGFGIINARVLRLLPLTTDCIASAKRAHLEHDVMRHGRPVP